jgi:antitoxin component YwqK of YwqJK toxin-antitoxin module
MSKIRSVVNFEERNGRSLSNRKEYFENGNLFREGYYSKSQANWSWDIPIGVVRTFNENGTPKSEELYDEAGYLDGESKFYNKKGELERTALYLDGKLQKETVLIDSNAVAEKKER